MDQAPGDSPDRPTPGVADNAADSVRETVAGTHEVLANMTTRFPFVLFPDSIVLDREKLTITRRFFFKVAEVTTIRVDDINDVVAGVGPLVGSVRIHSSTFSSEPFEIRYLRREDALKLKRILQGYLIAIQKGVDTAQLSTEELVKLLEELGGSDAAENI